MSNNIMKHSLLTTLLCLFLGTSLFADKPLVMAVMDPLSKELACPCVDGFAQRDYKALADYLKKTGDPAFADIELVFAGSLSAAKCPLGDFQRHRFWSTKRLQTEN